MGYIRTSFEGSIILAQPESVAINNFPKENNELASGSKKDAQNVLNENMLRNRKTVEKDKT
jgi:hypothetical protein